MEKKEIILERRAKVDGSIYQRDNLNVWYSIVGYVSRECIGMSLTRTTSCFGGRLFL